MDKALVRTVWTPDLKRVQQLANAVPSNMVRFRLVDLLIYFQFPKDFGAVDVHFERHVLLIFADISAKPDGGG